MAANRFRLPFSRPSAFGRYVALHMPRHSSASASAFRDHALRRTGTRPTPVRPGATWRSIKRAAQDGTQVIVSTQSAPLLNEFEPKDVVVVERHQGESTFRRLEPDDLPEWLGEYSLGELWQKNILGGKTRAGGCAPSHTLWSGTSVTRCGHCGGPDRGGVCQQRSG